ncbi:hypothetical protein E2553_32270 [Paraburkholderia dipogonis]|uniref:Uncharacterized protein n=1 Tax=Paraburkholderia dipogonis TaxID=1211383 RepID=A0A4Y8MVC4_9BURK|nr:hypothetical protein E2553_32270 [Paraburkholderia dipogonis]
MFWVGVAARWACGSRLRSCGLAVLRSCGLAVLRSCGLAVLRSCGLAECGSWIAALLLCGSQLCGGGECLNFCVQGR